MAPAIDGDAVCGFAYPLNLLVPEFYDLTIVQYSATLLFERLIATDYKELYYDNFGNLTASEFHEALLGLDHGTIHLESSPVGMTLMILMVIIVGLRIYSRVKILTGRLRLDDWLIIVAAILGIGTMVENWLLKEYGGIGKHYYDVTQRETLTHLKLIWSLNLVFAAAMLLIKLSFLVFYSTLSPAPNFRRACWVIGLFIGMGGTALFFALLFECWPVDVWNHAADAYKICPRVYITVFTQATFSVITDIMLVALPLTIVLKLRVVRWRDKLGMMFLFSLGGLVCFTSIMRMTQINPYQLTPDWTRYAPMYSFWFVAETQLALIASSLPALRALLLHFRAQISSEELSRPSFSQRRRQHGGMDEEIPEQRRCGQRVGLERGVGTDINEIDHQRSITDRIAGFKDIMVASKSKLAASGWIRTGSSSSSRVTMNNTHRIGINRQSAFGGASVTSDGYGDKSGLEKFDTSGIELADHGHRASNAFIPDHKGNRSAASFPTPPPSIPLPQIPPSSSSTPANSALNLRIHPNGYDRNPRKSNPLPGFDYGEYATSPTDKSLSVPETFDTSSDNMVIAPSPEAGDIDGLDLRRLHSDPSLRGLSPRPNRT